MKKSIGCNIIITSLRSKVDKSLGVSFVTPELSSIEKVAMMDLQGINTNAIFTPLDEPTNGKIKITKDITTKTQAERIRAVLFVWWKQLGVEVPFDEFYRQETEKYIDEIKLKLVEV